MKRVILYYLVMIATAVTVPSCDKEDTKKKEQCETLEQNGYSVTVCGGENGTVSITSETWEYSDRPSEIITISATANNGYRFLEWQGIIRGNNISGDTNNPTTFGMYHDANTVVLKAIFVPAVTMPKTIEIRHDNRGSTIVRYKYDSQNRFTEKRLILNNSGYILDSDIYLNYDDKGDLVEYHDYRSQLSRSMGAHFSKKGDKITFTLNDHNCVSCFQTVKGEFELNAQGFPEKLTYEKEVKQGTDLITKWRTYADVSITWQDGNLTKTDWKNENEHEEKYRYEEESKIEKSSSAGTTAYTHDDKKTPFSQCNTPKWFFWWIDFFEHESVFYGNNKTYNKNNIKTETREEDGSTIAITYEYTYNDVGFPVTRTWESENEWDAGTITETYSYY